MTALLPGRPAGGLFLSLLMENRRKSPVLVGGFGGFLPGFVNFFRKSRFFFAFL